MDRAGGLGRLAPLGHSPGAGFLWPHGEEGDEAEQLVSSADDAGKACFGEAERFEIFGAFFDRHGHEFCFDPGRHDHRLGIFGCCLFKHAGRMGVAGSRAFFLDIADIEDGLGRQQLRLREQTVFLRVARNGEARGLAVAQQVERLAQNRGRGFRFLVALRRLLGEIGHALFQAFKVGEHQFGFDRVGVGDRVDLALDMGDVVILETAQDMHDGIDFADIGEELVAEAFALGRAAHQTRNIDEAELRFDDLGAAADLGDGLKPIVGHRDAAFIGFDGAEGIIRRLRRLCFGERIEQGGLAHIGKTDDTATKTHLTALLDRCDGRADSALRAQRPALDKWRHRQERRRAR